MPRSAAQVMQSALPDAGERMEVIQLLMQSSALAQAIAPSAWAVSLLDWGFRLHVGQVEALAFFDNKVWLLLAAQAQDRKLAGLPVMATNFKCYRGPQSLFAGSIRQYTGAQDILAPLHTAFIEQAARTNERKPRKGTPFLRYHSQEMIDYATREALSTKPASF